MHTSRLWESTSVAVHVEGTSRARSGVSCLEHSSMLQSTSCRSHLRALPRGALRIKCWMDEFSESEQEQLCSQ